MPKLVILRIPGVHTDFRRRNPLPNLGVGFLAAIARQEGCDVAVLEGHMWLDSGYLSEKLTYPERLQFFLKETELEKPDMLGISVLSGDLALGIEFAKLYRIKYPQTFIIMGGAGVNGITDVIVRYADDYLDAVVEGEGEYTFRDILKEFKHGKKRNFKNIKGMSFREGRRWLHNPRRELIKDLDTLPLVTLSDYKYLPPYIITLLPIERGCSSGCRFCFATKTWGTGRYFSLDRIKRQGEILLQFQKAAQIFFLSDSNIFASYEKGLRTLAFVLKHFPQAVGSVNVRVDQITPELLNLFIKYPHVNPLMGIESLSPHLLNYLGKTGNPKKYLKQVEYVLPQIIKNNIGYCLSLIYHIPGETREDLEKIYRFFLAQNAEKCKLIYLSKLWLEGNTGLWDAYNRGELDIYPNFEIKAKTLGDQYNDVIFEPFSFLFRNHLISGEDYASFAEKTRGIFKDSPCYYMG